ncbi:MAG TPA: PAS domain-containing sensor histidine kinase [Pyrinomonadaceae bacterium]
MTEPSEQSQELFRLVVENVRDFAIYTKDLKGRILSWNPGVERLLGYPEEGWVGLHISAIFTPEDVAQGEPDGEMRTALAEGRAEDTRWHVRKDGSRFWANGLLMLLRDGSGAPRAFAKVLRDDTARHRAEEELRRSRDELERRVEERTSDLSQAGETLLAEVKERGAAETQVRGLLRRVVEAQELERGRIARDLHDNLGQELTAMKLNLDLLKEECGARPELCERIVKTQEIARRVESELDFIAWELRPAALDHLGLPAAAANFAGEWSKHYGIPCEFNAPGVDGLRLLPDAETNLYRIAQEALNNIHKHAAATRVSVQLGRMDGQVVLIVEDDGRGFEPGEAVVGERGMGLLSMSERAAQVGGTLEIESAPGKGTTVYARVPLAVPEERGGADGR